MAIVEIEGDELVVRLSQAEKIGAVHGDVRVPKALVSAVRPVEAASKEVQGLRAPGTGVPSKVYLGTWRKLGSKDFVAAYDRKPGIVIELTGHSFGRIIVSGDDISPEVLDLG